MLSQAFPYNAANKPLSEIDSLKRSIVYLQSQIDSLSKHTQINEIGQNFYSDAISRDLYMFSTIVVIAGLVSWGFIAGVMALHKRQTVKHVKSMLDSHIADIEINIKGLQRQQADILYDVNRSMYFIAEPDGIQAISFIWAMSTANALIVGDPDTYSDLTDWLGYAIGHLSKIKVRTDDLLQAKEDVIATLALTEKHSNEGVRELTKKIQVDFYHLIYSKPNAPSGLFSNNEVAKIELPSSLK
jgi:uncharacterized alkaline shock family protein YloU